MSAPAIWIGLPLLVTLATLLMSSERLITIVGGLTAAGLGITALLLPIDTPLLSGPLSFKVASTLHILGRSLVLTDADGSMLAIFYGLAALWFFGAETAGVARRLVPLGLGMIALLVASIAVEPFLFAATFIEMAILLAIPMLSPPGQVPGRGVVRFLVYQTLSLPFILFAGWMLVGVEASPGDLALGLQSATLLGMGFAFLLAVFPLYAWIPLLAEEASPFVLGFLLWVLPTITIVLGMGFLDHYAWLRTSPAMSGALQGAGTLMVVTGGVWTAFQRHLGRMMGYAAVVETGFVVMALGIQPAWSALDVAFLHLIPRGVGLAVWALSLVLISRKTGSLHFRAVRGMMRIYPLASAGVLLAHLSTAGFPLLAGFPPRLALWEGLAGQSLGLALWLLLGVVGLMIGAVRTLAILAVTPEDPGWAWNETWVEGLLLAVGIAALFILGLFPQLARPFLAGLPLMFTHLSQ